MQFMHQGDRSHNLFSMAVVKPKDELVQVEPDPDDENFNETIVIGSFFAWGILFLNCIFSASVPCWLMADVRSESFTRNSWRYLTLSVLLLPFLLYEQRNVKD